jgi:hypothetical protein
MPLSVSEVQLQLVSFSPSTIVSRHEQGNCTVHNIVSRHEQGNYTVHNIVSQHEQGNCTVHNIVSRHEQDNSTQTSCLAKACARFISPSRPTRPPTLTGRRAFTSPSTVPTYVDQLGLAGGIGTTHANVGIECQRT